MKSSNQGIEIPQNLAVTQLTKIFSILFFLCLNHFTFAQVTVINNGDVGVKNTNPQTELDVNGKVTVSTLSTAPAQVIVGQDLANTLTELGLGEGLTIENGILTLDIGSMGGTGWQLDGNVATETSILGTNNNQPLRIVTNGTERLQIDTSGRILAFYKEGMHNLVVGSLAGTYLEFSPGDQGNGSNNIFVGKGAGLGQDTLPNTGKHNIFMGRWTGSRNSTGLRNTFLGQQAGMFNTSGFENNYIGPFAGQFTVDGYGNNFIGNFTGQHKTTGSLNTFIGWNAGDNYEYGQHSTLIGTNAGAGKTGSIGGDYNTFIGSYAGYGVPESEINFLQSPNCDGNCPEPVYDIELQDAYNTFIGFQAGLYGHLGEFNTYIGPRAGMGGFIDAANEEIANSGNDNNFIGREAGRNNTVGSNNNFIGSETGLTNQGGINNNYVGNEAGRNVRGFSGDGSFGSDNNFIGNRAGKGLENLDNYGYQNNFIGYTAGEYNQGGRNNNYIGSGAGRGKTIFLGGGQYEFVPNNGNYNNFIGLHAGESNSNGDSNNFMGLNSGRNNTDGSNNVFVGTNSGRFNTVGISNTFIGNKAGYKNISGSNNLAIGKNAGLRNIDGNNNLFLGENAGNENTSGSNNLAIGTNAGYENIDGYNNLFLGENAGQESVSGSNNIFLGLNSAVTNETGSNNLAIGSDSEVGVDLTNANAIGYSAICNDNNKVRIGNTDVTVIEGAVVYSWPSDARFKSNIKSDVPGLDFIVDLEPVTYNFDTEKFDDHILTGADPKKLANRKQNNDYARSSQMIRTGFIAQDVEAICKKLGYDFDGLHAPEANNPSSHYSLGYASFVVPLVQAVKEQQEEIELLEKSNKTLQEQFDALLKRVELLEK